jgi:hypothetical protein
MKETKPCMAFSASSPVELHFADFIVLILRRKALLAFACFALFVGNAVAEQPSVPKMQAGPAMEVHFAYYPKDRARIRVLEGRLASAIKRAGAGELGETEYHADGNDGYLYMYGPDPDRLYAVVKPILRSSKLMSDAEVTKHYGSHTKTFELRGDGT